MSTRELNVSTLSGSTITISTLSGSTINVSTLSGSTINVSTLTGSTIQGTTVFFSTMTASTILTAGSTISLARNVNVPNRFLEVGCDAADSMYLDFHSKDSALPDYSTRIISQGGATTGTGGLNMYASTIGLMGTNGVGIGTTAPSAPLHVYSSGGICLATTGTVNYTNSSILGFGFGGGSTGTRDSFRIISQAVNRDSGAGPYYDYGVQADLVFQRKTNNLYASAANDITYTEVMRIHGATGQVGIGTTTPANTLHIYSGAASPLQLQQSGTEPNYITFKSNGTVYGYFGFENDAGVGLFGSNTAYGMSFGTPTATNINISTNNIVRMTVTAAGNVGIGITNPGNKLQVNGSLYASNDITAGGGYGRLDDRSLRPADINPATEQFFFASWNNDGGAPYADGIGMNGWTDGSGGNTNVLMVRKDTYGIRQYQGTFGSTTAFTSAQYQDCCMKGVGDNTKTIFQPVGGTWNVPLTVGSGTDSGGAQLITTSGNIHIDPSTGNEIYLGSYRNPTNITCYASSGMTNYTRYWTQYADVNGDASAVFKNANAGSSAYFNLIISNNAGNTNHFMNSSTRSADGGQNCYTIRNDTGGGVRFMGTNGGFSSYVATGTGGATYTNAIVNYQTGAGTGNIGTWAGYGFTLFCNTTQPSGSQAAYGIVSSPTGSTNFVVSLRPGITWMDLQVWAAAHYHYVNGAMAAYLVGGGWVNVSDEREKEDIKDLKTSRSLERIMKCKPKYYKRKVYEKDKDGKDTTPIDAKYKDKIHIGLLAQDVMGHNPHCVSQWKNEQVKESDDDDMMRFGINYGDYTVHLIGAVQEQQKQIDVLKQELEKSRQDFDDYKKATEARFEKVITILQRLGEST